MPKLSFLNLKANTVWTLQTDELADSNAFTVVGTFAPTRPQQTGDTDWKTVVPFGSQRTITQWRGGSPMEFQFEARLWARDATQTINEELDALNRLKNKDERLGRPPICVFNWGKDINMSVVVLAVGRVKYDRIRDDGTLRGAWVRIRLRQYFKFAFQETVPGSAPETKRYTPFDGEYFEAIAARRYGDPDKGVYLRQRHPGKEDLVSTDEVLLFDRSVVEKAPLLAYSVVFSRANVPGTPQYKNWQRLFASRNQARYSSVITGG